MKVRTIPFIIAPFRRKTRKTDQGFFYSKEEKHSIQWALQAFLISTIKFCLQTTADIRKPLVKHTKTVGCRQILSAHSPEAVERHLNASLYHIMESWMNFACVSTQSSRYAEEQTSPWTLFFVFFSVLCRLVHQQLRLAVALPCWPSYELFHNTFPKLFC